MRSLIAAAFVLLGLSVSPALAAPVCQYELAPTIEVLKDKQLEHWVLSPEKRAEFLAALAASVKLQTGVDADFANVTDVLMVILDDEIYFGLVVDGCLSPPMPLAQYLPEEQRSGWTPVGIFA